MSLRLGPTYRCAQCGTDIDAGDFIAVLGKAPASGNGALIGRADRIFRDIGEVYCRQCLPQQIEEATACVHY